MINNGDDDAVPVRISDFILLMMISTGSYRAGFLIINSLMMIVLNNNLNILIEMEETNQNSEEIRVRMPKKGQILGIIESIVGGSRMRVRCSDGKLRTCRIPGRFRKSMWVREGDTVLIEPWPIQGDSNADIVCKYTPTQANHLRKKNMLNF